MVGIVGVIATLTGVVGIARVLAGRCDHGFGQRVSCGCRMVGIVGVIATLTGVVGIARVLAGRCDHGFGQLVSRGCRIFGTVGKTAIAGVTGVPHCIAGRFGDCFFQMMPRCRDAGIVIGMPARARVTGIPCLGAGRLNDVFGIGVGELVQRSAHFQSALHARPRSTSLGRAGRGGDNLPGCGDVLVLPIRGRIATAQPASKSRRGQKRQYPCMFHKNDLRSLMLVIIPHFSLIVNG